MTYEDYIFCENQKAAYNHSELCWRLVVALKWNCKDVAPRLHKTAKQVAQLARIFSGRYALTVGNVSIADMRAALADYKKKKVLRELAGVKSIVENPNE